MTLLDRRSSGILLHPTSLPGRFGIGEIGPGAVRWLEFLTEAGQSLWQILPLGPTGHGHSPYSGTSTFAGNPALISIEQLYRDGLLRGDVLEVFPTFPVDRVDYEGIAEVRGAAIRLACENFRGQMQRSPSVRDAFDDYCEREDVWLEDFALFTALKRNFEGKAWSEWPERFAQRSPEALAEGLAGLSDEVERAKIAQFLFDAQWRRVKAAASERGIAIIGDLPIFVAGDGADVWANRNLFQLDESGHPTAVAGVPPDYFSATGQRWGNPLYRWSEHEKRGFAWWASRLRRVFDWVDILRIDHFRGFAAYWEIPADEPTAVNGRWVDGPGDGFFEAMRRQLGGELPIIAEDLGLITPDVHALRDRWGFPGMRVLQFAFGSDDLTSDYLPENYPPNSVAYTGTHDNDTTVGYFRGGGSDAIARSASEIETERRRVMKYFGVDEDDDIHWTFIRAVLESAANLVVIPMQDVLGLGSSERMNRPGEAAGNWRWRMRWEHIPAGLAEQLRELTERTGRVPAEAGPEATDTASG